MENHCQFRNLFNFEENTQAVEKYDFTLIHAIQVETSRDIKRS